MFLVYRKVSVNEENVEELCDLPEGTKGVWRMYRAMLNVLICMVSTGFWEDVREDSLYGRTVWRTA